MPVSCMATAMSVPEGRRSGAAKRSNVPAPIAYPSATPSRPSIGACVPSIERAMRNTPIVTQPAICQRRFTQGLRTPKAAEKLAR